MLCLKEVAKHNVRLVYLELFTRDWKCCKKNSFANEFCNEMKKEMLKLAQIVTQ